MFEDLSLPLLLGIFAAAAGTIWYAGIKLSDMTDVLSTRLGLGQALGGVILLAIATNLPESAITVSAAWSGNLGVAVGNILGGIAIQTVVLVILDVFGTRGGAPLTSRAASLSLALEGVLVIAVLTVAIMATQLPASLVAFHLTPGAVLITLIWVLGIWLLSRAGKGLPWHDSAGDAPDTQEKPKGHSQAAKAGGSGEGAVSTGRAGTVFGAAALVTLVAGVVLERSGDAIAGHVGMSGVLFGATVLAAATSLPEVSTGLASMKLKDYQLAVSDIFGGNAFLPVLFLLATLVSGAAVLPHAQRTDIYLAALGVVLTAVYICGLIFRSKRRWLGMGVDSLTVLVLYAAGIAGLVAIALDAPG
ncbi:sodium:calcium antiporter [Dankookia rubra]|uniref:Sodium:calcium antiporter n=1 Tax=Dankookia rubra TaxID=1442381 RepID=A0A4R5Q4V7_9PROT|nr:sodium:calcium antiporter [Dankookia rubra]TDH57960.1 sodium:calcium antiporter [Dankookia rubra]